MSSSEIRSVVILGGGTAGWMTAAALSKVFGPRLSITLIESEEIGTIGVGEATLPALRLFNAMLRLDEDAFVRSTGATFKLGIQFDGWRHDGHSYLHAFGDIGKDLAYIPFHHYWLAERRERRGGDLWDYSLTARAAAHNRFGRLPQTAQQSPLNTLPYGFHFDAGLYARFLRRLAENQGVRRREGKVAHVDQDAESGDILGLRLDSGETVSGDFFFDCSGFRGLLIEGALKAGFDDWTHWLPCDRAVAVPSSRRSSAAGAPRPSRSPTASLLEGNASGAQSHLPSESSLGDKNVDNLTPYTRSTARTAGWQWRIPLQHRTGNGHVYSSAHISDDEAAQVLMNTLDGTALDTPRTLRLAAGRRKSAWKRNCIALGLAAGFVEPLESTSIHMIQSAIERIIMLFPHKETAPPLIDQYNAVAAAEAERIRDFIILHYHVNNRTGEAFWDDVRHMSVPDTLTHAIELFRETGVVQPQARDLFQTSNWLQVMWGQGIEPRTAHPFVQTVSPADRAGYLTDLRSIVADTAARLPSHADFIARTCLAPANVAA